jgi:hypothetical protein
VIPDAALGRTPDDRVLDAVSGEDAEGPIVQLDGELHDRGAAGFLDNLDETGVELESGGGLFELEPCILEGIELLLNP